MEQNINMNSLPLIEIPELTDYVAVSEIYRDTLIIASIFYARDADGDCFEEPVRVNVPVVAVVLRGSAKINLDYVSHLVSANSLLTIMPSHIAQVSELSSDFKARLLILDKSTLEDGNLHKQIPPVISHIQRLKDPCTQLDPEQAAHIEQCFLQLEQKVKLRMHSFHHEVVQNATVSFLLELANILLVKEEIKENPVFSRKEEMMNRFFQLLSEHVCEQHDRDFYAAKLNVTSQYMSVTLKELTGKPASRWIIETLIIKAKMMLKTPHTTARQVARALHFSGLSSFCVFFKQHAGISVTEYRNS
jgi:AraC-like DNA-binding protein